jgi:hypothetical protein
MAATDVWDSGSGIEVHAPDEFRLPRQEYIRRASERMAPAIRAHRAAEPPAGRDLPELLVRHFNDLVAGQTEAIRCRINSKLLLDISGEHGGSWTVDFKSRGPEFVREGAVADWTYRIQVEDKLIYPFLTNRIAFFEHLLLSLRVRMSRRPDEYSEPLYHFLYEPDPEKLHNWYAAHRH